MIKHDNEGGSCPGCGRSTAFGLIDVAVGTPRDYLGMVRMCRKCADEMYARRRELWDVIHNWLSKS